MKAVDLSSNFLKVFGKKTKVMPKGFKEEPEDVAFLHGILSNDIRNLKLFNVSYNLLLDVNGNALRDFYVYRLEDYFLLSFSDDKEEVKNELIKLKLSLRVYFEDINLRSIFVWENPREFLKSISYSENSPIISKDPFLMVIRNDFRIDEEGYDIIGDEKAIESLNLKLSDYEEFESKRIEAMVPKVNKELVEGIIPLEAGLLNKAISLSKGCYTGQEAIARVAYRGRLPRALCLFETDRALKEKEKIVEDKDIGFITSVHPKKPLALGYLLRSRISPHKTYQTESGASLKLLKTKD